MTDQQRSTFLQEQASRIGNSNIITEPDQAAQEAEGLIGGGGGNLAGQPGRLSESDYWQFAGINASELQQSARGMSFPDRTDSLISRAMSYNQLGSSDISPPSGLGQGGQPAGIGPGSAQIGPPGQSSTGFANKGTEDDEGKGDYAESDSDAPPDLGIKRKSEKSSGKKDKNRKKFIGRGGGKEEGQAAAQACCGDKGCSTFW